MKFRTILYPDRSDIEIKHQENLLCIGSCFSENIGAKMLDNKFQVKINPFGTIFNPISIVDALQLLMNDAQVDDAIKLIEHNGMWHSFRHSAHFSKPTYGEARYNINLKLNEARIFFQNTKKIIITLGTSFVYRKKSNHEIVANCHKFPADHFVKSKLSLPTVIDSCADCFKKLKEFLPDLNIILTVSPVRHIKDGIIENQRSKATLILAAESLCNQFDFVEYFPAYELIMDDLRDYRFYDADLIHPNDQAITYIWQYFEERYFTAETKHIIKEVQTIKSALAHRAINPHSDDYKSFVINNISKIQLLKAKFPFLHFDNELNELNNRITS